MIKSQLIKFLTIGSLAAIINFLLVLILVELYKLPPLLANVFAFLVAFNVSYFGHRYVTFETTTVKIKKSLLWFFINACLALLLTEVIYFVLLYYFNLMYLIALVITMAIVSLYTFVVSKVLIFKA